MSTPIYRLTPRPAILHHWPGHYAYVSDVADFDPDMSELLIEARLRSGDYFVTLATELEKLSEIMQHDGIPEADALARFSSELFYLDKHFKLQHK